MALILDPSNKAAFDAALVTPHKVRIRIDVLNSDEEVVGPLEANVVGGQVDLDDTADISRTLTIEIADDDRRFHFDPQMGVVYADDLLQVWYGVYVDSLADWVEHSIFYGVVSRFSRSGHEVTIEAQSKEALWMPPRVQMNAPPVDFDGSVARYIKLVATDYGETQFSGLESFGDRKLPKDWNIEVVKRDTDPDRKGNQTKERLRQKKGSWGLLQKLSSAVGFQLYYDTYGRLTARANQTQPRWEFTEGESGCVLSDPAVGFDLSETYNRVVVESKDPTRTEPRISTLDLAAAHPLSKESLAWNGVNRPLEFREQVNKIFTTDEARVYTAQLLEKLAKAIKEVEFDSLPIPHLEPGDVALLNTNGIREQFDIIKYTIPLRVEGGAMSVGYNRKAPISAFKKGKFRTKRGPKKKKKDKN